MTQQLPRPPRPQSSSPVDEEQWREKLWRFVQELRDDFDASETAAAWVAWTPTGSWVANTTYVGMKRRIGDAGEYAVVISLTGAPTAATLTVNMPAGEIIDAAKFLSTFSTNAANSPFLSTIRLTDVSAGSVIEGRVMYDTTLTISPRSYGVTGTLIQANNITQALPWTWATGDALILRWSAPIVGWD